MSFSYMNNGGQPCLLPGFLLVSLVGLLLPTAPVVAARRVTAARRTNNTTAGFSSPGSILTRTFQWNSMKSDLTAETLEIFGKRSDADLVVTCMTEATPEKGIHEILAEQGLADNWVHVAYGRHTGMAGGSRNAQILSVFLRQPTSGANYAVDPPAPVEWQNGIGWSVAGFQNDEKMAPATIPGVLEAHSLIHQTSGTGKGGVSAVLSFQETQTRKATSVAVICAHFDSEDRDARRSHVAQMLEETVSGSRVDEVPEALKQRPCLVLDSKRAECEGAAPTERQHIDAMLLMGDLNFRIQYVKDGSTSVAPFPVNLNEPDTQNGEVDMAEWISDQTRRKAMFLDDPLNPKGTSAEALVQDSPNGFAFQCNDPSLYLPSYKRNKPKECAQLASKLRDCNMLEGEHLLDQERYSAWRETLRTWQIAAEIPRSEDCSKEEIHRLTGECFKDKGTGKWKLKREKKQDVQQRFLQLGWLDRVCFRPVDSAVAFEIKEVVPWDEHPFGDHAPVEMLISLANAKTTCEAPVVANPFQDPHFTKSRSSDGLHWQTAEGIQPGVGAAVATCPQGFRMNLVPEGAPQSEPVQDISLDCNPGGLMLSDGSVAEELSCLKYCGPIAAVPEKATAVDKSAEEGPSGALYVAGASTTFKCESGYELSGPPRQVCNSDGNYGDGVNNLKCLRTCQSLLALRRAVGVRVSMTRSSEYKRGNSIPNTPLEGDKLKFTCEDTQLRGMDTITCLPDGKFDHPVPTCVVKCGAPVLSSWLRVEVVKPGSDQSAPWEHGADVFEGYQIKYSCEGKSKLSGFSQARCDNDGTYHGTKDLDAPRCISSCKIPPTPPHSTLSFSNRDSDKQGTVGKDEVVEGTHLQFYCEAGCIQLGGTVIKPSLASIKCQSNGEFDQPPPKCACKVKMKIHRIDYGTMSAKAKEANQIKIKLFPFNLMNNIASDPKGYDKASYKKQSMDKFPTSLTLDHNLNTYFLHIELCASSFTRWLTLNRKRCKSLMSSDEQKPEASSDELPPVSTKLSRFDSDDEDEIPEGCALCVGTFMENYFEGGKRKGNARDVSFQVEVPMYGEGITNGVAKVHMNFILED